MTIAYSPYSTWYFTIDYKNNIDLSLVDTLIDNSSNLSPQSIRLTRQKGDSIYNYWVDIDTIYHYEPSRDASIHVKIIDQSGTVVRTLGGRLPNTKGLNLSKEGCVIKEGKKGDLFFCFNNKEYQLTHLGDEMGLHHTDIVKPKNLSGSSYLKMYFYGYDYEYFWLELNRTENGFFVFYEYSYEGELLDTIYAQQHKSLENIEDIKLSFLASHYYITQYHNGKTYDLDILGSPINGYGKDKEISVLDPLMHSFSPNSYLSSLIDHFTWQSYNFDHFRDKDIIEKLNNTVKAIGYSKFLAPEEYNDKIFNVSDYGISTRGGLSLKNLNDSLLVYKNDPQKRYYYEFWERRKNEGTDSIITVVINDMQTHYKDISKPMHSPEVDEILRTLLTFDLAIQSADSTNLKKYTMDCFDYLCKIGLKQSAYNLVYNTPETKSLQMNKDSVFRKLTLTHNHNKTTHLTSNKPLWIDIEK